MKITVVWEGGRGFWDEGFLERLFDLSLWRPPCAFSFEHVMGLEAHEAPQDGAVVVVPARWYTERIDELNERLAPLSWCLVVLCGDEESAFPWRELRHEHMRVWVQTPDPRIHGDADRVVGDYWPPEFPLRLVDQPVPDRDLDWAFAGQVADHPRRMECLDALSALPGDGNRLIPTDGFGEGLAYDEYVRLMTRAKIAPCPSGPFTPDTFRLYEALEAGCLPVTDRAAANRPEIDDYWSFLFGKTPPWPVIEHWSEFAALVPELLAGWPANANRGFAWWQQQKRQLAHALADDLAVLTGTRPAPESADDRLTVVIPTSPIPSHPDTAIIEETLASVRARLPHAEILVLIDGVRAEQVDRRASYDEYVRRLLWKMNHHWENVVPLVAVEHLHQANLLRNALRLVRTPYLLFVEHDTPLCEEIPFAALVDVLASGEANAIRLHHEALVHDEHRSLYLDDAPQLVGGQPLWRTFQWSQRPHLASVDWYRKALADYFPPSCRTMIEDKLHGVLQDQPWEWSRLWTYAPEGDMKRSYHLDGRGADPKFEMRFE